jgi:hypothetical protein
LSLRSGILLNCTNEPKFNNKFLHNSKVLKECMYWSVATEFGLLTDDQIKEVKTMNSYWYSHLQVYKNILTVPNVF